MKNTGKKFEEMFKKSAIEQGYDYTRLKDAGFVGDKSESRRFTPKNICDCIVFGCRELRYLELKSRASSLRFDEVTQEQSLAKKEAAIQESDKCLGAATGVVVNFQNTGEIFYYNIMMTEQLRLDTGKKSFNASDLRKIADDNPAFCFELETFVPKGKRTPRVKLDKLFSSQW